MKNRLLALMALCTATASTMPLWAAYPDDPALTFVSDDELGLDELMANPGTQKTFYMYHVATGKFLNDGNWNNNWNSEVVIADDGLAVTLSYGLDTHFGYLAEDDENYNPNMGFRLTTFEGHTNGNFHEIYLLNSSGVMCVDHNAQGRNIWKITKQDNGYYRISVGEGTPEFTEIGEYGDRCWAVEEGDNGVNGIMDMNAADYQNPQADWQFVAEDVYEVYNAKKNVLKPAIEEAEATPGVDCSAEKALYDKADATAEEITAAAEALDAKVLEAKCSSASPQNPVDVSDLMANPKFDGNANGWTTEREADPAGQQDNFGYQGSTQNTSDGTTFAGFWERWNPNAPQVDWSVHQDLNNIPNGRYKLTAYVLTNKKADEGGPQGLYVYATSFGAETRMELTFAYVLVAAGLLGTLAAFFCYNMWGKAEKGTKTFMGDSGSLFLGYVVAYLSIKYATSNLPVLPYRPEALMVSYTLLIVPTFDVIRVALSRLYRRKPVFGADKTHIHHVVMAAGFSMHQAWAVIMALFLFFCVWNALLYGVVADTWMVLSDILLFCAFHFVMHRRAGRRSQAA